MIDVPTNLDWKSLICISRGTVDNGLISPDDRENAINFFRRPRESKIYQQTTARISTNDIAVFSTITLQNLYHSNINSLLFRQPNITSQPYIHSHSHCCYKAIPYNRRTKDPCAYPPSTTTLRNKWCVCNVRMFDVYEKKGKPEEGYSCLVVPVPMRSEYKDDLGISQESVSNPLPSNDLYL